MKLPVKRVERMAFLAHTWKKDARKWTVGKVNSMHSSIFCRFRLIPKGDN